MAKLVEPGWNTSEPTGYTSIADVEWDHESYQFNMTRVYVEDSTGRLFYAEDSGCSCPSPFEDTTVEELTPIDRLQDWYSHVEDRTYSGLPTSATDEAETARKAIETHLKKDN